MAWLNPAVAAQLVAMVDAFLLRQREALPPLVQVAQPRVNLAVVDSSCDQVLVFVDVKLHTAQTLRGVCVNVLHMLDFFKSFVHLHLLDSVAHGSKWSISQELLAHHFSSNHYVGVAESVLGVRESARAALRQLVNMQGAEDKQQADQVH